MGDWDKPAPWYVYALGGLFFTVVGCVSTAHYIWAIGCALAMIPIAAWGMYRESTHCTCEKGLLINYGADLDCPKHGDKHRACLYRIAKLERELGLPMSVQLPQGNSRITNSTV